MENPEPDQGQHVSGPSSSSSSSSPSSSQVQDEENNRPQNGDDISNEQSQHNHIEQQQQRISRTFTYHMNLLVSDVAASEMKDDVWSCLAVLVTFWFFGQFPFPSFY